MGALFFMAFTNRRIMFPRNDDETRLFRNDTKSLRIDELCQE